MHDMSIKASSRYFGWPSIRIRRKIPSAWPEVSPARAWTYIDRLMTLEHPALPNLLDMLNLPTMVARRITDDQYYDLVLACSWMQIDHTSCIPLCKSITVSGKEYYLPSAKFTNVTGLEYALISDAYHAYIERGAQRDQDRMIAFMLRPHGFNPDPHSDRRVKLISSAQALEWITDISSLSPGIKAYLTLFVSANIQNIYNTYGDYIFKRPPDPSEEPIDPLLDDSSDSPDFGWWGTFMTIAEQGIFGPLSAVHQEDIHTICSHLVIKAEQAREHRRQLDQIKATHRT